MIALLAIPRRARVAAIIALLLLLLAAPGEAVTLRQYFFDLTDRDRGVYLTGLMDLLRADPQRESDFLRCVAAQGTRKMHDALTGLVQQEPRILPLDVAPWFFYAANHLCREAAPAVPSLEAPAIETALPDLPTQPAPAGDAVPPSEPAPHEPASGDTAMAAAAGAAAGIGASVALAAALRLLRRRRAGPRPSAPRPEEGA